MTTPFPKIILSAGKEKSILNFHPWLFSGAIQNEQGEPKEGDCVEIYSNRKEYLATGHYHEGSIKVRIFSFQQVNPDYAFWKDKLQRAFTLRKQLGFVDAAETNVYRLIHAEGDGMPGLIIDIYNQTAVIQTHTVGMHRIKDELVKALLEIYEGKLSAVYDKSALTMEKHAVVANGYLYGNNAGNEVMENNHRFVVNWEEGQKTGFFIDQRENRKLLGSMSKGKTVLNTFAYSGAFSIYALQAGATLVHSVDNSKKTKDWTEKNIQLNCPAAPHQYFVADAFDYLRKMDSVYDVIILDPPAFAKHLSSVRQAAIGYTNLNSEAFRKIKPNGILFTFSCSQVVDKKLFRQIVFSAAAQAKRNVKILHQLSQPADHPISIYHPEGEYLKGLVLFVE